MKFKYFLVLTLCLLFAGGCASPPKKERTQLPSQVTEPTPSQPPAKEKLEELVIPQREEAKKLPEKLYSFFAREANIQEVLLAFSRESELNIVMDPELGGKVTIDLKRVNLREALDAILAPLGLAYRIDEKFIKVFKPQMETRLFTLNYIATKRSGKREIYASTGGGSQINAYYNQQVSSTGTRTGYSDLISVDESDLWKDIQKGLEVIVFGSVGEKETSSETNETISTRTDTQGKKLIINKTSGVIMVADYPLNLNRVASYIETIEGSSQRQVSIQAKILEVILSDENKEGINWNVIESLPRSINFAFGLTNKDKTTGYPGGTTGFLSSTTTSTGATTIPTPGIFKIKPFGGVLALGAGGAEILLSDIMKAIQQQGDVKVLSSPTISTLNNQKAIIRVGDQDVFFISGAVSTQTTVTQIYQPQTIDIGIILDVTPQISEDGTIIMNIHPSITQKTGE